jgi:hypothetical protein
MSNLFTVLAGQSPDTFTIGGVKFMAAPVALDEYAEFLSLQGEKGMPLDVQANWMADKLRRRTHGKDTDPAIITQEWVLANVPLPTLSVLQHVLLYGEMPRAGETPKA